MTPNTRISTVLCAALLLGTAAAGCDDADRDGAPQAATPDAEPADAAAADAAADDAAFDALRADLERIAAEQLGAEGFPGIGITVALPSGRVLHASAGRVGPAAEAPVYSADDTVQVIGSVSKLFTAALVMQLVERGALSLDARIDRWFAFDGAADVSVRMLLDHTAGLADYLQVMPPERMSEDWSPAGLIELAVQADRYAPPGGATAWYSNTHYVLLARIVEAVSGRTWQENIALEIADPLGLTDLGYAGASDRRDRFVDGWYLDGDRWGAALDVIHPSIGWGVGALVASGRDLARFGRALFDGELFEDPTTLDDMLRFDRPLADSLRAPGEPPQTLGLGVIRYALGGDAVLDGHFGRILGYQAGLFHDPTTGAIIAISANVDGVQVGQAALATAGALHGHLAP